MAPEPKVTADALTREASHLVSAIVFSDETALQTVAEGARQAAAKVGATASLPLDVWSDARVVYGVMLAVAEIAETASRAVVPPKVLLQLVSSAEVRRLLQALGREGPAEEGSRRLQAAVARDAGMFPSNAQPRLAQLTRLGLIGRTDLPNGRVVLELLPLGYVALNLIDAWQLDATDHREAQRPTPASSIGSRLRNLRETILGKTAQTELEAPSVAAHAGHDG